MTKGHQRFQFVVFLVFHVGSVFGQNGNKQISNQQLIWYGYINTIEFADKYFLTTEVQERRFFAPDRQHQFVSRSHLHYQLGQGWDIGAGFTYFLQSPQDPNSANRLVVPELRPHLEFNYKQNAGKISLSHRYKAEWRFIHHSDSGALTQGYGNYFRFRYRFGIEFPLAKKKKGNTLLKFKISDEFHINVGRSIVRNVFDQNRVYLALHYQLNPPLALEAGYLNWFQQRSSGDAFYNRNIIRFSVFHKIDLNNKS